MAGVVGVLNTVLEKKKTILNGAYQEVREHAMPCKHDSWGISIFL